MRPLFQICFLLLLSHPLIAQNTFTCDGQFFLIIKNPDSPADSPYSMIYELKLNPNTQEIYYTLLNENIGATVNAAGYRSSDNYIYALQPDDHDLYQIDAAGAATFLKNLNLTTDNHYVSGDISPCLLYTSPSPRD